MSVGRIPPFSRPTTKAEVYNLGGYRVKLKWRFDGVAEILAPSREAAEEIVRAHGGQPE